MRIETPMDDAMVERLHMGDRVEISGIIYTGRDAAHKRMMDLIEGGDDLPFDVSRQIIYYVGPTPPRDGVIGSAGPTTAYRMDAYTIPLLQRGLKGMIGKGYRGNDVAGALKKYKAVYLAAIGGVGALYARHIIESEIIAYEDLGTEAIRRLLVKDFPAIVAIDAYGGDIFSAGKKRWSLQKAF